MWGLSVEKERLKINWRKCFERRPVVFRSKAYCIVFIILVASCATSLENLFTEDQNAELVEVFDLNKEKFGRFKVAPIGGGQKKQAKGLLQKISSVFKKTKGKKGRNPDALYPTWYPEQLKKYDRKSQKVWKVHKNRVFPGEELILNVRYLGVVAGHVKIITKPMVEIDGRKAWSFKAILKSARFYNFIYSLNDSVESYVTKDDFLPIKYALVQRETSQNVDDLQLFDQNDLQTYFWYKRIKRGKLKKDHRIAFIPYYSQDSFSALFFTRGLPLEKGRTFEFPIVTRAKIWLLKMTVIGEEKIDVAGKTWDALKVKTETHFPGVLKKRGDIIFWYSADKLRRLLKFKAKVKIGSLHGEMVSYRPALSHKQP